MIVTCYSALVESSPASGYRYPTATYGHVVFTYARLEVREICTNDIIGKLSR